MMAAFVKLYQELDGTNSTLKKKAAMLRYFSQASAADSAWAVLLLKGDKLPLKTGRAKLLQNFAQWSELPEWLIDEARSQVGDSAEALALLRGPGGQSAEDITLDEFIRQYLISFHKLPAEEQTQLLRTWWQRYDEWTLFFIHKCFTGGLRLGVSQLLLVQALAQLTQIDKDILALRLTGKFVARSEAWEGLISQSEEGQTDTSRPYPFYLASPLEEEENLGEALGNAKDWMFEWKWDGIRCQIVKRAGQVAIWSRGGELLNEGFPDLLEKAQALPNGTVLDGELLPYQGEKVGSFNELQERLNRKKVSAALLKKTPVTLMAYDLLEYEDQDWRERPLAERRAMLEKINLFPLSQVLMFNTWEEAARARLNARALDVEGLMLKRLSSTYQTGRRRGDWWKWKIDPLTLDCVLLYAQSGSGKRASLYSDFTLGVWKEDQLVPLTKAYSGLTDEELGQMDHWIKTHTTERFGPVRAVKPEMVFEIAFEGIRASPRHKSGIALRFPRIARWRKDKPAAEADTLDNARRLLES